jgi:hypothetical protein
MLVRIDEAYSGLLPKTGEVVLDPSRRLGIFDFLPLIGNVSPVVTNGAGHSHDGVGFWQSRRGLYPVRAWVDVMREVEMEQDRAPTSTRYLRPGPSGDQFSE